MNRYPLFYPNGDSWIFSKSKRITLIGMSGLGKTHISNMLNAKHGWLHYSIDYKIGSVYMRDAISKVDETLKDIANSKQFTINDLSLLSKYLGKPGNPEFNGLDYSEYKKRQKEHKKAEIASMLDIPKFIKVHLKPPQFNFVCDTSGSLCEIVDPLDPSDPILSCIAKNSLMVLIKESEAQMEKLKDRFKKEPKPMYYEENFLNKIWEKFCNRREISGPEVNPDEFSLYGFEELMSHRRPIYQSIAKNWGIEVPAIEIGKVQSDSDLKELIYQHLPNSEN